MSHCNSDSKQSSSKDWMMIITLSIIASAYGGYYLLGSLELTIAYVSTFTEAVVALVHRMWWGVLIGIMAVGALVYLPQEAIIVLLGSDRKIGGIVRATVGGVLLDLCSHGILLVGMQLYRRGASLGQTMAFLIASPWNSLSFTVILFSLIGVPWTLIMIAASMIIAMLSGMLFDALVRRGVLPKNPARTNVDAAQHSTARALLRDTLGRLVRTRPTIALLRTFCKSAWGESQMVIRWISLGIVIAAAMRSALSTNTFEVLFGPTLVGITLTVVLATLLEVCSEGSAPFAADIFNRAQAPGNGFAFLMAGVATDYTELASLKETTASWKISFFLPLVTLPQIIALAVLFNHYG